MDNNFYGTNATYFVGVVEDINDPLETGRVRVRIFGVHTEDDTVLPISDLPWSQISLPTTEAGTSGIGRTPTGMLPGTQVFGFFFDPESRQNPLITGVLAGISEASPVQVSRDIDFELGDNNPIKVWNYLISSGASEEQAAAVVGLFSIDGNENLEVAGLVSSTILANQTLYQEYVANQRLNPSDISSFTNYYVTRQLTPNSRNIFFNSNSIEESLYALNSTNQVVIDRAREAHAAFGNGTGSTGPFTQATTFGDAAFGDIVNSPEQLLNIFMRSARTINKLVVHWTATYMNQNTTVVEVDDWHRNGNGWANGIGYHFLILRDGSIQVGRNIDIQGAHTTGHNRDSLAIAFVGGYLNNSDSGLTESGAGSLMPSQFQAFNSLLRQYAIAYPDSTYFGHSDLAAKDDPGFDVRSYVAAQQAIRVTPTAEPIAFPDEAAVPTGTPATTTTSTPIPDSSSSVDDDSFETAPTTTPDIIDAGDVDVDDIIITPPVDDATSSLDLTGLVTTDALTVALAGFSTASTLEALTDTTISASPTDADYLRYDGATWRNAVIAYGDISGTPTLVTDYSQLTGLPTLVTDYSQLTGLPTLVTDYSQLTGLPTLITALPGLSDVTITTAIDGNVLRHNGSNWINAVLDYSDISGTPTLVTALPGLSDVTLSSPIDGNVLRHNGTVWVNAVLDYADITGTPGASDFVDLTSAQTAAGIKTWSNDAIFSSDVTVNQDLTITGNLTVSGTTTYIDTTTLNISDNIFTLNADEVGTPSQNAGMEVERGTSTNVTLRWNESTDVWEITNDGASYYEIQTTNTIASGDFVTIADTQTITGLKTFHNAGGIDIKRDDTATATNTLNIGQTSDVEDDSTRFKHSVVTGAFLFRPNASTDTVIFHGSGNVNMTNNLMLGGTDTPTATLHIKNLTSHGALIQYDGTSNNEYGLRIESNISGGNFESDFSNGAALLDLFANSATTSGGDIFVVRTQSATPILIINGSGMTGMGSVPATGYRTTIDNDVGTNTDVLLLRGSASGVFTKYARSGSYSWDIGINSASYFEIKDLGTTRALSIAHTTRYVSIGPNNAAVHLHVMNTAVGGAVTGYVENLDSTAGSYAEMTTKSGSHSLRHVAYGSGTMHSISTGTWNIQNTSVSASTIILCNGNANATFASDGSVKLLTGVAVSAILDDDTMTADSATALVTQQSLVAYVGTQVAGAGAGTFLPLAGGGMTGDIDMNSNDITEVLLYQAIANSSRDKIRVWSTAPYSIGMQSAFTFGHLDDFAMTFQMNNDTGRGWWFGHDSHTQAQGAMSLTTDGRLWVDQSITVAGNLVLDTTTFGDVNTWTAGQTFSSTVAVTGVLTLSNHLDMGDDDIIKLGTGDDFEIFHDGTTNRIDLNVGDLAIRDNATLRFTFARTTGDFTATGNVTANSDATLKNILNILDRPSLIDNLTVYDYTWKKSGRKGVGPTAQEVQKHGPEFVIKGEDGILSLDYGKYAVALIYEEKQKRVALEDKVEKLEAMVKSLLDRI